MNLTIFFSAVLCLGGALAVPLAPETNVRNVVPDFAEQILVLQERLEAITHTSDAWLNRQRNRVDDSVGIINSIALSVFANGVQMVHDLKNRTITQLNIQCRDEELRESSIEQLNTFASTIGSTIATCAGLVHDDLDRLIKQQFYEYMHTLQRQSISAKTSILLGFEVFNPVTNQNYVLMVLNDMINSANSEFEKYLQPEVEEKVREMGDRGQLMVGMATTCAYDVAIAFSQMVHETLAVEC